MPEERPGSKEYNVMEAPVPEELLAHARELLGVMEHGDQMDITQALTLYTNRVIQRERSRFIRMLKHEHTYQDRHGTRLAASEPSSTDEEKKAALWNCAYTHAELIKQVNSLD